MSVRVLVLLTLGSMIVIVSGCGSFHVADRGLPELTQQTGLSSIPQLKVSLMAFADGRDFTLAKGQHAREVVGHVRSTLTRALLNRDFTTKGVVTTRVTETFANEFRRNGHTVLITEELGVPRVCGVVKKYWIDGLQEAYGTDFSGSVIVEIELKRGVGDSLTKTFSGKCSKRMTFETRGAVEDIVADSLNESLRNAVISFANDPDVLKFLREAGTPDR